MKSITKFFLFMLVLTIATANTNAVSQSGIPGNGLILNDDWASFPQSQVWENQLQADIVSGPVFVGSRVVVALENSQVNAFSIYSGKLAWSYKLDQKPNQITSSNDSVFVKTARQVTSIGDGGQKNWIFQTEANITTDLAILGNMLFFGCTDGNFYCVDVKSGKKIWLSAFKSIPNIGPKMLGEDHLFFASTDKKLYCLNTSSGKQEWELALDDSPEWIFADQNRVLAQEGKYLFAIEASSGNPRWKYETGTGSLQAVSSKGKFFVTTPALAINCFDANFFGKACCISTGKRLWLSQLDSFPTARLFCSEETIFVPKGNLIEKISAVDGSEQGDIFFGKKIESISLQGDSIAITSGNTISLYSKVPKKITFEVGQKTLGRDSFTVDMGVAPVIVGGRSFLPARYICEPFGGSVSWDQGSKKTTCQLNGKTLSLWVGKNTARTSGGEKRIDNDTKIAPFIQNGRVMIPVRFMAESLGLKTSYEDKKIIIDNERGQK
ncbi:MAG: PQQ-binding-like beta-propeller repeat protein [Caldisericales bacterium]|nr:PQQ-binding-like beta-propeller repeat protein [Caldisericales bacterium]